MTYYVYIKNRDAVALMWKSTSIQDADRKYAEVLKTFKGFTSLGMLKVQLLVDGYAVKEETL